jgi:hypothetical protein
MGLLRVDFPKRFRYLRIGNRVPVTEARRECGEWAILEAGQILKSHEPGK